MARWCAEAECAKRGIEIPGAVANCSACGTAMSGIKPPGARMPITNYRHIPRRLPEMNDAQWTEYQQRVQVNSHAHNGRAAAQLVSGRYLYHATSPAALTSIVSNGLRPRDPSWRPYNPRDRVRRFDASKDGFLSMSTTRSGAGTLGGNSVLLRMLIGADTGHWDFRQLMGSTEVRTTTPIPPELLEQLTDGGNTWRPLVGG